ncbi:MAG: hypothetical protein ACKO3P_00485, partial [Planctomycetaceae bacterium]
MPTHRSQPRPPRVPGVATPAGSLRSPCPGPGSSPLGRRSFLQLGTLGMGGFGLADWLRLRARAEGPAAPLADPQTSVIFIWLPG